MRAVIVISARRQARVALGRRHDKQEADREEVFRLRKPQALIGDNQQDSSLLGFQDGWSIAW